MIHSYLKRLVDSRLARNVSWIFFGNVLHAVLSFGLNLYIARVLSLNDNGMLSYASSWIAFFSAVGTLGFNGIISREFSKNEGKADELLASCIAMRVAFSVIAVMLLQFIVHYASPGESDLHKIVLYQSLSLLFTSFDLLIYWYRYKDRAKVTAAYRLIAFFCSAFFRVLAISIFRSTAGYALGVAIESLFFMGFLVINYYNTDHPKISINYCTIGSMLSMSYPFILSAILSTLYGQADKIMLKSMMDNNAVALYSASTTIAGLLVIIPTTLIEGFRPDIMDAKLVDERLYQRRLSQLYSVIFWGCFIYGVVVSTFPKQIIYILYGSKYLEASQSLSLIVWYSSFSYFGAINNVYMVAEERQKWVQVTTLTGAIANIILNMALIPRFGIVGAAVASLVTQIISNFALMALIKDLRKGFKLMIQGIFLRWL